MFKKKSILNHKESSSIKNKNNKPSKIKNKKTILVLQICVLIFFGGYFIGLPVSSGEETIESNPVGLFNSELITQDLNGNSIYLNKYWKIQKGDALNINIINSASISEQSIKTIKNTIMSTDTLEIDDSFLNNNQKNSVSTYYVGWKGALQNTGESKIPIPKNFKITNSPNVYGDIIVILSNIKDRSGNSGYTKTVLEEDEIVKAFITIYEVNSLSKNELGTIMRHEFGHALGLGHATDSQDLMAPTIDMTYPFISQCNISAMTDLYNDKSGITTC